MGPLLTCEKFTTHPIFFWCLEAYEAYYIQRLSPLGITVNTVEDYLKNLLLIRQHPGKCSRREISKLSLLIEEKVNLALNTHTDQRDVFREYVTIKALMQYFLQNYFSGYFMDSNIMPEENSSLIPQTYDSFLAPIIPKRDFAQGTLLQLWFTCDVDPWLMLSPKKDKEARLRFRHYYKKIEETHEHFKKTQIINRKVIAEAFVTSALISLQNSDHELIATGPSNLGRNKTETTVSFLGFYKRYSNTHKLNKGALLPLLMSVCTEEHYNPKEVEHYLKAGHTPSQSIGQTTLLKTLIHLNKIERVRHVLTHLSTKEVHTLFSSEHSFLFYVNSEERRQALTLILNHYIDVVFESTASFIHTVLLIQSILTLENNGLFHRKKRASESEITLIEKMITHSTHSPNLTLAQATRLVTQLGPLTEQSIANYTQSIKQTMSQPKVTSSYFFTNVIPTDEAIMRQLNGHHASSKKKRRLASENADTLSFSATRLS